MTHFIVFHPIRPHVAPCSHCTVHHPGTLAKHPHSDLNCMRAGHPSKQNHLHTGPGLGARFPAHGPAPVLAAQFPAPAPAPAPDLYQAFAAAFGLGPVAPVQIIHCSHPRGCLAINDKISACHPGELRALFLAANVGRPGGSCGDPNGAVVRQLQRHDHRTQEENVLAELHHRDAPATGDLILAFLRQYGMLNRFKNDHKTVQKIDYSMADPRHYAHAWDAHWSADPLLLVVAAGAPNAGKPSGRSPSSTMARTFNRDMAANYQLFRTGLEWALRAALDLAKAHGASFVILPLVGGGIYAGRWKARIKAEYPAMLAAVCAGAMSDGTRLAPLTGMTVVCVTL